MAIQDIRHINSDIHNSNLKASRSWLPLIYSSKYLQIHLITGLVLNLIINDIQLSITRVKFKIVLNVVLSKLPLDNYYI